MPSLQQSIDKTLKYVGASILDIEAYNKFKILLEETCQHLIKYPLLSIVPALQRVFDTTDLPDSVKISLVRGLKAAIVRSRPQHPQTRKKIHSLHFELVRLDEKLVIARLLAKQPDLAKFPRDQLIGIIEDAAFPLALLLGSNIAESLAWHDPGGVFEAQYLVQAILDGTKINPDKLLEIFTLDPDLMSSFRALIIERIGNAAYKQQERHENLLKDGQWEQYLYERFKMIGYPDKIARFIALEMATEIPVEDLHGMNAQEIKKAGAELLQKESKKLKED